MNQDQIKAALLKIQDAPLDFTLIFSGKKSKRVHGLYKPDTREIIIHNRNFDDGRGGTDDNLLLYTAIHEYAHHLHACARGGTLSAKAHTAEFWAILHGLLEAAEVKGVYRNVFDGSAELAELTETIREQFLKENGNLVKALGKHLLKAHDLCVAAGGRWEDYIDRVLRIPRAAANLAMRMHQYNLNPETGADNMRFLAGIKNEETRQTAETALLGGKSPDTVKVAARREAGAGDDEDPRARLEKEKTRLERTIASLSKRLEEVERKLETAD